MLTTEQKQVFEKAVEKYGFGPQLNQLQEECAELIVACNKLRRNGNDAIPLMIDELADVKIMVEQITQAMNINDEVQKRVEFKIERLKNRLER